MCTVNAQLGLLSTDSSTVRLTMKLHRYGQWGNNTNLVNAESKNSSHNGSRVRKSQSASSASQSRTSLVRASKTRSHQEPVQTQGLPIPLQGGRPSLSRSVDKSDLTRMYDYATWNMYERIVSARRMRLASQIEASSAQQREDESSSNVGAGRDVVITATSDSRKSKASFKGVESSKAAPLVQNRQDARSLDETDRSSIASTLTDTSRPFVLGSSPPEGGLEDHFIFQLDL